MIEFGCPCLELNHFGFNDIMNNKIPKAEQPFQTLLGMNEELVTGHEYTFEIKDTSVNLVKSSWESEFTIDDQSKYVLTYAQGKRIIF